MTVAVLPVTVAVLPGSAANENICETGGPLPKQNKSPSQTWCVCDRENVYVCVGGGDCYVEGKRQRKGGRKGDRKGKKVDAKNAVLLV